MPEHSGIIVNTKHLLSMKRIMLFVLVLLCSHFVYSQGLKNNFRLTGKISGATEGSVVLYYLDENGKRKQVKTKLNKGSFSLSGKTIEAHPAYIYYTKPGQKNFDEFYDRFFLEPGNISMTTTLSNFSNAKYTGSKLQTEYSSYQKIIEPYLAKMKPILKKYSKVNNEYVLAKKNNKPEKELEILLHKADSLQDCLSPYSDEIRNLSYKYYADNPNSLIAVNGINEYAMYLTLDSLQMYYNNLTPAMQQSFAGKKLQYEIEKLIKGSTGSVAIDFSALERNGGTIKLSDYKGKYVLLDFWASWCIPCRKSNPKLRAIYSKYQNQGLEIIGIADNDNSPDEWRKAIEKDSIGAWPHILRGYDSNNLGDVAQPNDISEKYGVKTLPTKILIDKNGVIIGRYTAATDEEEIEIEQKIEAELSKGKL